MKFCKDCAHHSIWYTPIPEHMCYALDDLVTGGKLGKDARWMRHVSSQCGIDAKLFEAKTGKDVTPTNGDETT